MPIDPTTYLLDFDMESFHRQLSEVTEAYQMMTESYGKGVDLVDSKLQILDTKLTKISTTLDVSMSKLDAFYYKFHSNLTTTSKMFKDINDHALKLNETLKSIGGFDPSEAPKAGNVQAGPGVALQVTATGETSEEMEASLSLAEKVIKKSKDAVKETKEAEATWKKTSKKIADTLKKDMQGAVNRVKSIMNSFSGGAIAGGGMMAAIGLMVMGVQEKQRRGAERGEMKNAFEGMGDLFEKDTRRSVNKWSQFQEKAQWHWSIGRKEIQMTIATIRNAGFKDAVDKNLAGPLKMADKNATAASIQLDKFLNVATGTSAKQAIEISEKLGHSFETSLGKMTKLRAEAKRSGMDFEKFTSSVLSGSSAMQQYRVDVGEVAEVMRKVKKHYEGLGMSGPQAGAMASKVVGEMSQFNLADTQEMKFFQQYYSKQGSSLDGIEARQRGREEFTKGGADSSKILIKRAQWLRDQAKSRSAKRSDQIFFLEKGHGMSQQQATTIMDVAGDFSDDTALPELTKNQTKELKNAFQSEGSKLTQLQKNQRDLVDGLSKMGEGMLSLVSNILAVLILGIRSLPATLSSAWAMLFGTNKEKDEAKTNMINIANIQDSFFANMGAGIDKIVDGWGQTQKAIGSTLDAIGFGSLKKAATVDIGKTTWTSSLDQAMESVDQAMLGMKMQILQNGQEMNRSIDELKNSIGLLSDKELENEENLRMQVMDQLIDRETLRAQEGNAGYSDDQLNNALMYKDIISSNKGIASEKLNRDVQRTGVNIGTYTVNGRSVGNLINNAKENSTLGEGGTH